MAKTLRVDTPLPLRDIDLEDSIGRLELVADRIGLSLDILTANDGQGQRRLVCNSSGELTIDSLITSLATASPGDGSIGAILKSVYDILNDVYDQGASAIRTTNAV